MLYPYVLIGKMQYSVMTLRMSPAPGLGSFPSFFFRMEPIKLMFPKKASNWVFG